MSALGLEDIKEESFSTRSEYRDDAIVVWMIGNADMLVHEHLKGFLDRLDAAARFRKAKETVFELQDLYFMNSSCLALLLRMINHIVESKEARAYSIRFRSNPNLRWQRRSLRALQAYAQDLVVVE